MRDRDGKRWVDQGGDELHRIGYWEQEDREPIDPSQALHERLTSTFWAEMEQMSKDCDEELMKAGFPPAGQSVRFNSRGQWCPDTRDDRETAVYAPGFSGLAWGAYFAEQFAEPFSSPWYAAKLAKLLDIVLRDRQASYDFHFARIFNIGVLVTEWEWRTNYKSSILRGHKLREASKAGGLARSRALNPRTKHTLNEMKRLTDAGHTVNGAAEAVARKGIGTSAHANRALWNRHRGPRRKL